MKRVCTKRELSREEIVVRRGAPFIDRRLLKTKAHVRTGPLMYFFLLSVARVRRVIYCSGRQANAQDCKSSNRHFCERGDNYCRLSNPRSVVETALSRRSQQERYTGNNDDGGLQFFSGETHTSVHVNSPLLLFQ